MTVQAAYRTVRGTTPTTDVTKDYTEAGISDVPVGAIILGSRTSTEGTKTDTIQICMGVADGTREYVSSFIELDNAAESGCKEYGSDTACYHLANATTEAVLFRADFDSFIAGGIRLNFTDSSATAATVEVLLFYGDDFDAYAFTTGNMISGNTDVIDMGFDPTAFVTFRVPDLLETWADGFQVQIGMATGPGDECCQISSILEAANPTVTESGSYTDRLCFTFDSGSAPTTVGHQLRIDGISAGEVTFDTEGGGVKAACPIVIGIALRPSTANVSIDPGDLTPTTDITETFTEGWRPGLAIESCNRNSDLASVQAASFMSFGFADLARFDAFCVSWQSQQNQANVQCAMEHSDQLIALWSASSGSEIFTAAPDDRDATSWDDTWTNTAATARRRNRLVFEDIEGETDGSAAGSATVTGTLTAKGELAGAAAGAATASGTLTARGELGGASAGAAVVSGTLQATGRLEGSAAGVSSASAEIAAAGALSGVSAGSGVATGTLTGTGQLGGAAAGASTAQGTLEGLGALEGAAAGAATVTGTLVDGTPAPGLAGVASGQANVTGTLVGRGALEGTAAGVATATGTLVDSGRGCFELIGIAARTRFEMQIASVHPTELPVLYSNELEVNGSGEPIRPEVKHVELDILSGPNELVTMGRRGAQTWRKEGQLVCQVFTKAGTSWTEGFALAKLIEDAFTDVNADGLRWQVATTRQEGRVGAWWVHVVECPFVAFDDRQAPLIASDGDPGLEEAASVIELLLWQKVLQAAGVPVAWPNVAFDPPNALHCTVDHLPGDRIRLERGVQSFTRPGITVVLVLAPTGQGDAASLALADLIIESITPVRQDGVLLEGVTLERLGRAGPFYQVAVTLTWRADTVTT